MSFDSENPSGEGGHFWVDGGCKVHYMSERDILVTSEIKQYLLKAKENLALSVRCVNDKILFTCCIMASLFLHASFILLLIPFV